MPHHGKEYEGGRKLLEVVRFFGWVLLVVAVLVPFIQESFGVHFLIGILAGVPYFVTAVGLFALVAVGGAIFDIAESSATVAHRAAASPNKDADQANQLSSDGRAMDKFLGLRHEMAEREGRVRLSFQARIANRLSAKALSDSSQAMVRFAGLQQFFTVQLVPHTRGMSLAAVAMVHLQSTNLLRCPLPAGKITTHSFTAPPPKPSIKRRRYGYSWPEGHPRVGQNCCPQEGQPRWPLTTRNTTYCALCGAGGDLSLLAESQTETEQKDDAQQASTSSDSPQAHLDMLKVYADWGDVRYEGARYRAFCAWWRERVNTNKQRGAYLFAEPLRGMWTRVLTDEEDLQSAWDDDAQIIIALPL